MKPWCARALASLNALRSDGCSMDTKEQIQQLIETVLAKMSIEASIETAELLGGVCYQIKTTDGGALIGENGQNMLALYYLVKRMAEKQLVGEPMQFSIDVNDYQRKRVEEMKERARMGAQRVRYFKKEVVMQPMSAYERRIIHITLAEDPDIVTESRGEGEVRSVVIKPVSQ